MRMFLTIILMLFFGVNVFATSQEPDKIIYKGQEYMLFNNPLETYFKKYPDKRPTRGNITTGLWRGYIATFEVRYNRLFLKDIQIEVADSASSVKGEEKWISVLNEVFPNKKNIKIDWLTGLLVIPHGKCVRYVHMGYGSIYASYTLLEFDKGKFRKEKSFDYKEYEEFKERQFQAYKKTEEYAKIKQDLKKKDRPDEFIESFLRIGIIEYSSKILTE